MTWGLFLVVAAGLAQLHGIAERLSWCNGVVAGHSGVIAPTGGIRAARPDRGLRLGLACAAPPAPTAIGRRRSGDRDHRLGDADRVRALPGRPGQIVVSTSMLPAGWMPTVAACCLLTSARSCVATTTATCGSRNSRAATFPVLDPRKRLWAEAPRTERWAARPAPHVWRRRPRLIARAQCSDLPLERLGLTGARASSNESNRLPPGNAPLCAGGGPLPRRSDCRDPASPGRARRAVCRRGPGIPVSGRT